MARFDFSLILMQIQDLTEVERSLLLAKKEMAQFQIEYTEAIRKYKEVNERLKTETETINGLLKVYFLRIFAFQVIKKPKIKKFSVNFQFYSYNS